MKIVVVSVGKIKERFFRMAQEEYVKRIRRFVNFEIIEGCEKINTDDFDIVVSLDENGEEMGSLEFANLIKGWEISGKKVCFIVGGWSGLKDDTKEKSDLVLSLSKMTFPYQIACLILLEQIYRAFTIIRGIDYHK